MLIIGGTGGIELTRVPVKSMHTGLEVRMKPNFSFIY